MISIYSPIQSTRLTYTLDVLLKNILQVDYIWVDKDTYQTTSNAKINYSQENLGSGFWIVPHSIVFESDIKSQDLQVTHSKDISFFFKTSEKANIKFDILASSFYMLSRYEEYLPFTPDVHGRFPAEASLAHKANFLHKPIVHLWANILRKAIAQQMPDFNFPKRHYTQLNTIDIDVAYVCKGKPLTRKILSFLKALYHFYYSANWESIFCSTKQKDKYDTYDLLEQIQKESGVKTFYFFQVGKYGRFDKNLPLNRTMQDLIKRVQSYASIGLHPSYQSNQNILILQKEYTDLSGLLKQQVIKSRQHYLKMKLPETYENLIKIGVKEDYTMGFADQIGFRAGMAIPFSFFNLKTNKVRPLQIVPFQVMDGTLKNYLQVSPEEAVVKIKLIKETINNIGGEFVSIFHNSSLTDKEEWRAWLEVYRAIIF